MERIGARLFGWCRRASGISRTALQHGFVHPNRLAEFRAAMHDAMSNRDEVHALRLPQPCRPDIDRR